MKVRQRYSGGAKNVTVNLAGKSSRTISMSVRKGSTIRVRKA